MSMATTWKVGRVEKRCAVLNDAFAAMVGCTGKGKHWRHAPANRGVSPVEYACPACKAFLDATDGLAGPAHQAALNAVSQAAGVRDYRLVEVVRRNGRPVLTGKADAGRVEDVVREFAAGYATARQAARAIHILGGDCTAMVRRNCTPAQRAELVAAYKAERLVAEGETTGA